MTVLVSCSQTRAFLSLCGGIDYIESILPLYNLWWGQEKKRPPRKRKKSVWLRDSVAKGNEVIGNIIHA